MIISSYYSCTILALYRGNNDNFMSLQLYKHKHRQSPSMLYVCNDSMTLSFHFTSARTTLTQFTPDLF